MQLSKTQGEQHRYGGETLLMATPEVAVAHASQDRSIASSVSEKYGKYKREEGKREEGSVRVSEDSAVRERAEEATVVV